MYLINARGRTGGMSVVVANATDALTKLRDFDDGKYAAVVYDHRGRERSVSEIEAEAANETRGIPPSGAAA